MNIVINSCMRLSNHESMNTKLYQEKIYKNLMCSNELKAFKKIGCPRECARIQTFPDSHKFYYKNVMAGYKMVGNAVPSYLGYYLAQKIMEDMKSLGLVDENDQIIKVAS